MLPHGPKQTRRLPKLALGPFNMLCDALRRHKREPLHRSMPPLRFVLHPIVFNDLIREIGTFNDGRRWYLEHSLDGTFRFMGVPLILDFRASEPKLITCINTVQFL